MFVSEEFDRANASDAVERWSKSLPHFVLEKVNAHARIF